MKIDETYKGLRRLKNGDYVLEGDLISKESIEIGLDNTLFVNGRINSDKDIKAKCNISVRDYIIAYGSIYASGFIYAGESILAGRYIYSCSRICADYNIRADRFIYAGRYIHAGSSINSGQFIRAREYIDAGQFIRAREYIDTYGNIYAGKSIKCAEIRKGKIVRGELIIAGGNDGNE